MTPTEQDRQAATLFYFKPEGITGEWQDWIDGGVLPDNFDTEDVRDLAAALATARAEGFRACRDAALAACRERREGRISIVAINAIHECEAVIFALPTEGDER